MALDLVRTGEDHEAVDLLLRAVQADPAMVLPDHRPAQAEAARLLARLINDEEQLRETVHLLREARARLPDSLSLAHGLMACLGKLGEADEAGALGRQLATKLMSEQATPQNLEHCLALASIAEDIGEAKDTPNAAVRP